MKKQMKEKGITLIALIVTIIIMLILIGVTLNISLSNNGLLKKASEAKSRAEVENLKERVKSDILENQIEDKGGDITAEQLRDVLDKYFKDVPKGAEDLEKNLENPDYSLKARDEYGKDIELKVSDLYDGDLLPNKGPKVNIDGKEVTLTKENVDHYIGKIVTNFKDTSNETENVGDTTTIVSTQYRLYYIDFENKYGDGYGTIYLKADSTNNTKTLASDEIHNEESEGIRIKQLNPGLYKDENGNKKTPPRQSAESMKTVTCY